MIYGFNFWIFYRFGWRKTKCRRCSWTGFVWQAPGKRSWGFKYLRCPSCDDSPLEDPYVLREEKAKAKFLADEEGLAKAILALFPKMSRYKKSKR